MDNSCGAVVDTTKQSTREDGTEVFGADTKLVKCLKCGKVYTFPTRRDDYLAHLYMQHRLVIADVDDIAMLEDYLIFWENEFKAHEFEEFCTTMFLDQLPDGTPAKNEKYYLLCDILPKDQELRKQLQKQRLETALKRHQFELTDRTFSKECLYCRDVIVGLRADYFEHLYGKHFLLVGKPENLVYVDELLVKLEQNLEKLVCLYCEKIFKDRVTLKEHMRKKGHKRINPNNREYDKYFLINYHRQPLSKATVRQHRQQQQHAQRQRTRPRPNSQNTVRTEASVDFERHFVVNDSDDNDSDWSDWNGEGVAPIKCLYCSQLEDDFVKLKQHISQHHYLDFDAAVKDLNFYQRIKVVNYVRRQMCLLRCVTCDLQFDDESLLSEHMHGESHCGLGIQQQWNKPEYFFPYLEDDGLLCVLDDSLNDIDDTVVISEDTIAQINKDAERLSLENFQYL